MKLWSCCNEPRYYPDLAFDWLYNSHTKLKSKCSHFNDLHCETRLTDFWGLIVWFVQCRQTETPATHIHFHPFYLKTEVQLPVKPSTQKLAIA